MAATRTGSVGPGGADAAQSLTIFEAVETRYETDEENSIQTMRHLVTAKDLADALNRLRVADPMWEEGGFRVGGRWLEIDPDASDELAARILRCDLDRARRRNDREARWLVAGGVGVVYNDDLGWQPAPNELFAAPVVELVD
jgi:hypothetical protein